MTHSGSVSLPSGLVLLAIAILMVRRFTWTAMFLTLCAGVMLATTAAGADLRHFVVSVIDFSEGLGARH